MDRFRIHSFDVLDSTQIQAKKPQYHAGDVITAITQTAGYGRRGRAWQAPIGNLYFSMVEDYTGPEHLSWIGYAVTLGLYDAIAELLPAGKVLNVKWPNDLLINHCKLSGILLEIDEDRLIIGIGMNVAITPVTDQPVTALNSNTPVMYEAKDILPRFLSFYQRWYEVGQANGFAAMRDTWMSRAAYIGNEISARLANGNILTGVFKDIDNQGALVLSTESGQYNVTSADIYLKEKE